MNKVSFRVETVLVLVLLSLGGIISPTPTARASLVFHYTPETGNLAFDTSNTRSGIAYTYVLEVGEEFPIKFRNENWIKFSNSSTFFNIATEISDASLSMPWEGLYTIGDILPAGLTTGEWDSFAAEVISRVGNLIYVDVIGGGSPPLASFSYGAPDGEFANRWDLVDPDTLIWAQTPTLVYQAWSGELLLETDGPGGGHISSFYIEGVGDVFDAQAFLPPTGSPLITRSASAVGQISDALEPGTYSLGQIMEAGLSAEEFETAIAEARFLGRAGFSGGSFDFATEGADFGFAYVPVPEPAVLGTILCMMTCLLGRRHSVRG